MKTITVKEMMKENEKFFSEMIRILKDGGFYICPNTLSHFRMIRKKLVPLSKKSYEWIKNITTSKWCDSNVVPYVDPQMN